MTIKENNFEGGVSGMGGTANTQFKRNCPTCNKELHYVSYDSFRSSDRY